MSSALQQAQQRLLAEALKGDGERDDALIQRLESVIPSLEHTAGDQLQSSNKESQQKLDEMYEIVKAQQAETLSVCLSSISSKVFQSIQDKASLAIVYVDDLPSSGLKEIDAFSWDDRNERTKSDRYLPHLQKVISLGSRSLAWIDAAKHPTLLSCNAVSTLGRRFSGTTDVAIVSRGALRGHTPSAGLHLLFELKITVRSQDVWQARASLLLANVHSFLLQPMLVLTDLVDDWQLFWLDGNRICSHAFLERAKAVGFIEAILSGKHDAQAEGPSATAAIKVSQVAKRRRIADTLVHGGPASESLVLPDNAMDLLTPAEITNLRAVHLLNLLDDMPVAAALRPLQPSMYG